MTAVAIEIRPNREGRPRAFIAGTRVRVQDVYALAEVQGRTPDEIASSLPHLSLAQVHAALAYYFEHREAILDEVREDDEFARHLRAVTGSGPVEQKLKSTEANRDSVSS
jgi:uncharacterized protein (DUF433 family)